MAAPTPKPSPPPWYQFSLRSLLLLTFFVAVLCSLGVYTHWLVSAVVAMTVVIGGIAGRIVAGTRLGFVRGAVYAIAWLLIVFIGFPQLWQASASWRY